MTTPTLPATFAALLCALGMASSAHAMNPKDYPWILDMANCAAPEYPKEAQRNEETGTTDLELLIRTDGTVAASLVKKSSGHPVLDEAAQAALSSCRLTLKKQAMPKEEVWQMARYVWTLEDNAGPLQRQIDNGSCVRPPYPAAARDRRMTGALLLALRVRPDGTVHETKIVHSSGHPALDTATRTGLAACRFTDGGGPAKPAVDEWITMDYVWTEEDWPQSPPVPRKKK